MQSLKPFNSVADADPHPEQSIEIVGQRSGSYVEPLLFPTRVVGFLGGTLRLLYSNLEGSKSPRAEEYKELVSPTEEIVAAYAHNKKLSCNIIDNILVLSNESDVKYVVSRSV